MVRLRTALLYQEGNFAGREYFHRLVEAGRAPDLVCAVGRMKDESIARELDRTGGAWNPPQVPAECVDGRFTGTSDPALWALLRERGIDLAIQGGIGILKPEMFAVPRFGFVNVHPGKLPEYRGNSCPEWALWEGHEIWATAHMVDEGIDTGPVICAQAMSLNPIWDYGMVRASIYPHCANVLIQALDILDDAAQGGDVAGVLSPQSEQGARYLPPIPEEMLTKLKGQLASRALIHSEQKPC